VDVDVGVAVEVGLPQNGLAAVGGELAGGVRFSHFQGKQVDFLGGDVESEPHGVNRWRRSEG